ncbi:hypothetical protein [Pseudomonas sp. C9-3]|uniref:hypothetical protein n=1 Tax=Pseudomonas sp. C9-3 TaxID=3078264 RepID=UPI0028EA3EF8|nr:hypothetical protein [Pseudomonas sp. C9-3]
MPIQLTVIHRTDQGGNPIAYIKGFPHFGATFNPEQMHEYARQLHQAAIAAQQGERGERQYPAKD